MNALSANRAMTPLEWIMLLTLSLVWGGSYFFVALAVTALPPLTIVMCRVGIASLALCPVFPDPGIGRRYQFVAGNNACATDRYPARHSGSWRESAGASSDGPDVDYCRLDSD